ncbi:MAG: hypothetical protein ACKVOG_02345 [Rhodoglobus sp.]
MITADLPEDISDDEALQSSGTVGGPARPELDASDPRTQLHDRVKSALLALPGFFSFDNPISGINATDLFNLNSLLGAGIEIEVVRTLNRLRDLWDPDDEWLGFRFERSSQSFPDVRLVRRDAGETHIAIGIELKGWFLLAKEGEPSLRYQVSPAACAPHDLVCVVPWYLSNAVAGTAQVVEPWVESAVFAANWRDHWWQHVRRTTADTAITYPESASPYPTKAELVLATPAYDGGNNFGRLPRCKPLMDEFLSRTLQYDILGIPAENWYRFLRLHSDTATRDEIRVRLEGQLNSLGAPIAENAAHEILAMLSKIESVLRP